MNYDNYISNDYQGKLNEANKLLNEAKELLANENINALLNVKFANLSTELRGLIVSINEMKISETREYLEHYNYNELQKSYAKNKEDLVRALALNVDFESLFIANKDKFININNAQFEKELQRLLDENEPINEAIFKLCEKVINVENEMSEQMEAKINDFDLTALCIALLKDQIISISKEVVKENVNLISKESAKQILNDEAFLNSLLNEILEHSIFKGRFKMALYETLESINKKALEKVMNHRELKKMMILQDMVTASLSLQNELKIITENMNFINDYKLIEKRKEFLESLNDENAKLLYENKLKAV